MNETAEKHGRLAFLHRSYPARLLAHPAGGVVAFFSFMAVNDVAAVETVIPAQLGFHWQSRVVFWMPLATAVGCLILFLLAPVGNQSAHSIVRGLGRIPVVARYAVFVILEIGLLLLALGWLHLVTSSVGSR